MTGWTRAIGPLFLFVGGGLVVHSVLQGNAHLYLLLVVPVVSGSSAEFFFGVLLVALGIFLLPWSLLGPIESEPPRSRPSRPADAAPSEGSGGVILVGPIPIFFGSWRSPSRARYLTAVGVGLALLLVVVALFLLF
jgi:uncharacterized protein (TIGR00304 family)